MKRLILFALGATCCMGARAQVIDDDFDSFINKEASSFDKFIDDANKQFVSFLRNPWKEFESEKPVEKRVKPEPPKPVVYDAGGASKSKPVELSVEEILNQTTREGGQRPQGRIVDGEKVGFDKPKPHVTPSPVPSPSPVSSPSPVPSSSSSASRSALFQASAGKQAIDYCGLKIYIDSSLKGVCSLGGLSENIIADAYEALCKADSKPLLAECRQLKKDLALNDWGVFLFVREASRNLCTDANSAVVMQQFLLNELGYKAKMARRSDKSQMLLFVATGCKLYGRPYFTRNGEDYYNLTDGDACSFYMCRQDSPKAKNVLDMQVSHAPLLNDGLTNSTHTNRAGTVKVSVDVPKSLMEFYKSMPQCDYGVYVNAKVNPYVADKLLATLEPLVAGKSETEAADLLVNFVQTGFEYATDQEQFGYEKPFFVEELFYYPYCDCEDRSVLYCYLVRNLLKLDVVLLDYPEHIATAVCFNEDVSGDFVSVDGKKYVVCDPTYIGASIGNAMPQFKNVAAKVLKY